MKLGFRDHERNCMRKEVNTITAQAKIVSQDTRHHGCSNSKRKPRQTLLGIGSPGLPVLAPNTANEIAETSQMGFQGGSNGPFPPSFHIFGRQAGFATSRKLGNMFSKYISSELQRLLHTWVIISAVEYCSQGKMREGHIV